MERKKDRGREQAEREGGRKRLRFLKKNLRNGFRAHRHQSLLKDRPSGPEKQFLVQLVASQRGTG